MGVPATKDLLAARACSGGAGRMSTKKGRIVMTESLDLFESIEIDCHDMRAIGDAIEQAQAVKGKPTMIICETIKGKGVKQFEGVAQWHYGGIASDIRDQALADIDNFYADKV